MLLLKKKQFIAEMLPNPHNISGKVPLPTWDLNAHKRALQLYFIACYCET